MAKLVLKIALFWIIYIIALSDATTSQCYVKYNTYTQGEPPYNNVKTFYGIHCHDIGSDGRSLDHVFGERLRESSRYDDLGHIYHNLSDIAGGIPDLALLDSIGNITIGENTLQHFPNVTNFGIIDPNRNDRCFYLDISRMAFTHTPNLELLYIYGYLLNQNSIRALETLKPNLTQLKMRKCNQPEMLMELIANWTGFSTDQLQKICAENLGSFRSSPLNYNVTGACVTKNAIGRDAENQERVIKFCCRRDWFIYCNFKLNYNARDRDDFSRDCDRLQQPWSLDI